MSPDSSVENYNFQKIIVSVGVSLFFIKVFAWYMTHSVSILTDAMESIVNVVGGFVGLFSLYISTIPPDKSHPYGHGKIEFLSAGIEGTMVAFAGLFVIYKAIDDFIHPKQIGQLDYGILLIAATALVNYSVGSLAVRKGRKNNSMALIASGKHLKTDTYSTLGIIIGLILILVTGYERLDNIVAFVFGMIIIFTGVHIIRKATAGIMDESDEELLNQVVGILEASRKDNWVDLHNLRLVKYGNKYHIDCTLTIPAYMVAWDAQSEISAVKKIIRTKFYQNVDINVQTNICIPSLCSLCRVQDCWMRKYAHVEDVVWTVDNVTKNRHHKLTIYDSSAGSSAQTEEGESYS